MQRRLDGAARLSLLGRVLPAAAASERPALPDYELLRLIGRGSYGDVWIARSVTGAYRAVKIVWRSRFDDAQPYEREFKGLTEFAAISLEESRQLALLHVSRTPEFFYYVMELADDREHGREINPETYQPRTLKDAIGAGQGLPAADVLRLALDLSQALAGLHARGLVHRDIKPSNVIFVSGVPKLADIGLVATASAGLTFVGTEGYVPPEGPGAPAADVYSLGKVLYELATGLGRNDYPRLPSDLHAREDRKALLELNEIILRACAPHPENRYRDAGALLEELQLLQAGKSVRRLRLTERRLGRALRLAAVLAVIATVAGAGAWIENRRAADAEAERDLLRQRTQYISQITQARMALDNHDYGGARRLLASAAPGAHGKDLRGVEWRLLQNQANGDPAIILRSTGPAIDTLHVAPDRSLYAAHDDSSTLEIFEATTHRSLRRIPDVFKCVGFTPDGQWLVGTSLIEGRARAARWRVTSEERQTSSSPALRPLAVTTNHELIGLLQATAGSPAEGKPPTNPQIVVWDFAAEAATTRTELSADEANGYWEFFRGAADNYTGEVVLALIQGRAPSARFRLVTWTRKDPTTFSSFPLEGFVPGVLYFGGEGTRIAFAHDYVNGQFLRHASANPTSRWSPFTPVNMNATFTAMWPGSEESIEVEGPDLILRKLTDSSTRIWHGHGGPITTLAVLDANRMLSATASGELRLWDRSSTALPHFVRQVRKPHGGAAGLCVSRDGAFVFAPIENDHIGVFAAEQLRQVDTITELSRPLLAEDKSIWGVGANPTELLQWDLNRRAILRKIPTGDIIRRVAASKDLRRIVILGTKGELSVAELSDQIAQHVVTQGAAGWSLIVNREATCAWIVNNEPALRFFHLQRGEHWKVPLAAVAAMVRLSGDDQTLALPLMNGTIEIREAASGRLLRTLVSGRRTTEFLDFTEPPIRLVTASDDGRIRVVDPESGNTLAVAPSGFSQAPHDGALSPECKALFVVTKPGTLERIFLDH